MVQLFRMEECSPPRVGAKVKAFPRDREECVA
jgi:hypothetical protein